MQLQCPKCHAEIEENTLFCEQCGRQIRKLCPHCNNLVDMDAAFCDKCGNTLITEKKARKKRGKDNHSFCLDFAYECSNFPVQVRFTVYL